jgi:hypothetical protein
MAVDQYAINKEYIVKYGGLSIKVAQESEVGQRGSTAADRRSRRSRRRDPLRAEPTGKSDSEVRS